MQLSQIRLDVQYRAGDSSLSTSNIDLWVNQGIKQWAARADWPSLAATDSTQTTTAGTQEYSLPSDFKRMIGVRVQGSGSTAETDSTEYSFIRYEDKNVSTEGNYYYINPVNDTIGLIPEPDVTGYTIHQKYYQIPADISAATDEPPFPANYHELVVFFALSRYWEGGDEFDKKVHYSIEFENMIERMKTELLSRGVGQLRRVRDIRELMVDGQPQMLNSVDLGK